MSKRQDLIGKKFGFLKVIDRDNDYISPKGVHYSKFKCKCDCGNIKSIIGSSLLSGCTKSCGCLVKKIVSENQRKKRSCNKYDLSGEYGIGYTSNTNESFYFDLEDYDKIKKYYWLKDSNGYLVSTREKIVYKMHRLIMDCTDSKIFVDHINHNTLDNRKCNLRMASQKQNCWNRFYGKNKQNLHTGVTYITKENAYRTKVSIDNKNYWGYFRVNKYGDEAYKLACEWVEKKDLELKGEFSIYYNHNIDEIKD